MAGAIQLHPCSAEGIQRSLYRPCGPDYCASVAAGVSPTPCQLPAEIRGIGHQFYGGIVLEHTDRRQFYLSPQGTLHPQPRLNASWFYPWVVPFRTPPYPCWSGWNTTGFREALDG
jgi:hypothetical protein